MLGTVLVKMTAVQNLQRQQAAQAASTAKRPLDNTTSSTNGLNGLLNGTKPLTATPVRDAKRQKTTHTDDSKVVIQHSHGDISSSNNPHVLIELSSDEDQEEHDSDDEDDEEPAGNETGDEQMGDGDGDSETNAITAAGAQETADAGEASFGELLVARGGEPLTIDATMDDEDPSSALTTALHKRTLAVPSATSLGTVLTQALRSNDTDLLESCLQVPNLESIRATIERLHSSLAAKLLQKLAERMHKRPGRAGSLMVWVQWTVVAHGGYLAGQSTAMKQLHTLYEVVKQRATGLQPLLTLKGKLDMLEAQMQLRRNILERSKGVTQDEEVDEPVIYVEGEEDDSADEDELSSGKRLRSRTGREEIDDSEEDENMANGIKSDGGESDGESDEEDEGSDNNLLDDEAEETENESDDLSEDIDYDDVDEDGTVQEVSDSEEEQVQQVKAASKKSLGRR